MGNQQQHPDTRKIHAVNDVTKLIAVFNLMDQSRLQQALGFKLFFSQNYQIGMLQSYGSILLSGRVIHTSEGQPETHICLTLNNLLELRDMIIALSVGNITSVEPAKDTCCLCLDHQIEMMLPCSHAYCAQCLNKFVLDKQQKKCPMCRVEYKQPKREIQKELTEIYENEKEIMEQIATNIKELIKKGEQRQYQRKAARRNTT